MSTRIKTYGLGFKMRIDCIHGFYIFTEEYAGDVARFASIFGIDLESKGELFTFKDLIAAPDYSIKGADILANKAKVTHEGRPWEVMEANGLVYDFTAEKVVDINSIRQVITLSKGLEYYFADGLIVAGSLAGSQKIKGFKAWFNFRDRSFKYSEVSFV